MQENQIPDWLTQAQIFTSGAQIEDPSVEEENPLARAGIFTIKIQEEDNKNAQNTGGFFSSAASYLNSGFETVKNVAQKVVSAMAAPFQSAYQSVCSWF
ncbi:MAG: hypothetical protein H0X26_07305 [Alphaproteobacteria bacterium]|nr:hypothetical protein [Alphaproteobacteria bacterium]